MAKEKFERAKPHDISGPFNAVMKVAIEGGPHSLKPGDHIDLNQAVFDDWCARDMCELSSEDPTFEQAVKGFDAKARMAESERDEANLEIETLTENAQGLAAELESLEWAVRSVCEEALVLEGGAQKYDKLAVALAGLADLLPPIDAGETSKDTAGETPGADSDETVEPGADVPGENADNTTEGNAGNGETSSEE